MNSTGVEITAGLGGFLVLFFLAIALILLGMDLNRRLRRLKHQEELRQAEERITRERRSQGGGADGSGGGSGASGDDGSGDVGSGDDGSGDDDGDGPQPAAGTAP